MRFAAENPGQQFNPTRRMLKGDWDIPIGESEVVPQYGYSLGAYALTIL
jgi:hypothetical protein